MESTMTILDELKRLKVLLENRNYGDQMAVYHLVDILIKHFSDPNKSKYTHK